MPNDREESRIHRVVTLGRYYAWRGGSGPRDDYSHRIVLFKRGDQPEVVNFAGRVARAIIADEELNKRTSVLVPIPASRAHDPQRPHRGELLCQAVAAMPGIRASYGNYLVRTTAILSSHGRSVATRPPVEEHVRTMEVRIPHPTRGHTARLGPEQRQKLDAILFDDVRYVGATSEACARLLLRAGFRRVYAIFLGQNQP